MNWRKSAADWSSRVRKLAPLMVPVTIHAIAGSEDIIDAMDLRRLRRL